MPSRRAFTLVELLIVIVIIGILAAVSIPKFSHTKDVAYTGQLKSDLRNLVTAEESYFNQNGVYASDPAALVPAFSPSPGVTLTIVQASGSGWSATAVNTHASVTCAVFFGVTAVAPATTDGQVACQ